MSLPEMNPGLRRIGEYLPCPPPDIEWALSVQAMESASGNLKRLGEILIGREQLTQETLAAALETQLIDRLRLSSLLADLSTEELSRIGERTQQITLEPGETLFQEGYRGDSAYVILSGRLMLSQSSGQIEYAAGVVIPGDVLGEGEFFTDGTRSCSAYATEYSVLLKVPYSQIPGRENPAKKTIFTGSAADIVRRACAVLRADRAYLFMRDRGTGNLTAPAGDGKTACAFEIMAGTDIIGWVALKREIVNLREAYLDPRFDAAMDIKTDYWTRTLLAAPIMDSHGEVMGVLEVVNKRTGWFDADDEAVLHAFTKQCAAAL